MMVNCFGRVGKNWGLFWCILVSSGFFFVRKPGIFGNNRFFFGTQGIVLVKSGVEMEDPCVDVEPGSSSVAGAMGWGCTLTCRHSCFRHRCATGAATPYMS